MVPGSRGLVGVSVSILFIYDLRLNRMSRTVWKKVRKVKKSLSWSLCFLTVEVGFFPSSDSSRALIWSLWTLAPAYCGFKSPPFSVVI